MTILTNHHARRFSYRYEVPESVLSSDFDYLGEEDSPDGFFKYRGCWYHLSDFMRSESMFPEWHGYTSDSFFSGVLIKLSNDGETFQVATYIS